MYTLYYGYAKEQALDARGDDLVNQVCEHEDLSLSSYHSLKKSGMTHTSVPYTGKMKSNRMPGTDWSVSLTQLMSSRFSKRPSKKKMKKKLNIDIWPLYASTPIHTYVCTHIMSTYLIHIYTTIPIHKPKRNKNLDTLYT